MVKYVLTMQNIGFTKKIMPNSIINLKILYTEYFGHYRSTYIHVPV